MLKRRKKGDTLIEVALAIGIFSLVAVTVVAVLSASSSGSENTLETTLARGEIDAQAEAIRFIHDAASAELTSVDQRFLNLWNTIISRAVDLNNLNNSADRDAILKYSPTSCEDIYSDVQNSKKPFHYAFVLNPRTLGSYSHASTLELQSAANKVYYNSRDNSSQLKPATTYPRLYYSGTTSSSALLDSDTAGNFRRAEGIYVIGVKEQTTTATGASNFYDFYIRTCWYGTNNEQPITISTLIRLNDLNATRPK